VFSPIMPLVGIRSRLDGNDDQDRLVLCEQGWGSLDKAVIVVFGYLISEIDCLVNRGLCD
jgi:hypothetical protein